MVEKWIRDNSLYIESRLNEAYQIYLAGPSKTRAEVSGRVD